MMNGDVKKPAEILDVGWQFYPKPTSSDPPGTVFRIDSDKRRFKVGSLNVKIELEQEASGKNVKIMRTKVGILARIFGLFDFKAKREVIEKLEFEMKNPIMKEVTSDKTINDAVDKFLLDQQKWYRAKDRYFVIRETRKASGVCYFLSK